MRHFFREGRFIQRGDRKVLQFESHDASAVLFFNESLYQISSSLGLYNFDKLEGTPYFFIYKKGGTHSVVDPEEVKHGLRRILSGDLSCVVNHDTTLGISDESIENDVFWDVNTDIVIVKGAQNLKQVCIELLMAGYERFGISRNPDLVRQLVSRSMHIPIIEKASKLNPEEDSERFFYNV